MHNFELLVGLRRRRGVRVGLTVCFWRERRGGEMKGDDDVPPRAVGWKESCKIAYYAAKPSLP